MEWEGQPPAAPMGAVTATRHLSCACTCRVRQRGKGREGVSVSIRCVQITRYVWRAWCAATIQITHPHCHSSMQMACKSAEREKRRREKRGWQLTHSLHRTSSWHTPPLISSPPLSSPFSSLVHTHNTHSHHHLHITAPPTQPTSHTRPKPHPMHVPVHRGNAAAAAAAARLLVFLTITSSSSPPPPACHTCTHKQQVVHV